MAPQNSTDVMTTTQQRGRRIERHRRRFATLAPHLAAGYPDLPDWSDHTLYPVRADPRQTSHRSDPAAEAEATALLDRWMDAWNAHDIQAWVDTFNFPSARVDNKGGATLISKESINTAVDADGRSEMFKSLAARTGWHHSSWDRRTVIWSEPHRCCFDTCFSRYRANGTLIGVYESIYIVTKDETGHWGVKSRCSTA